MRNAADCRKSSVKRYVLWLVVAAENCCFGKLCNAREKREPDVFVRRFQYGEKSTVNAFVGIQIGTFNQWIVVFVGDKNCSKTCFFVNRFQVALNYHQKKCRLTPQNR